MTVGPAWTPSSDADNDWGRLRATAAPIGASGFTDITSSLRGAPIEITSFSFTDPFGPEAAVLTAQQVTPFDTFGSGDLAWIADGTRINIEWVHTDEATVTVLWEGTLESVDLDWNETGGSTVFTCSGALFQSGDYQRLRGVSRQAASLEAILANEFSPAAGVRPNLYTLPLIVSGGPTGLSFQGRPGGITAIDYVRDLLSRSAIDSGADQWTVQWQTPRQPVLVKRSAWGTTYHLSAGQPGLSVRVTQDWSQTYNVIYGEGVDTLGGGGTWSNLHFFGPDDAVFYEPLAYDTSVHGYDEDGSGGLTDNTSRLITSRRRRERYIAFGEGFSLNDAKDLASQYLTRDSDPGWVGEATLRVGPEESVHNLELKAGDRFVIRQLAGSGSTGKTFSAAHVVHQRQGGLYTTTLTLDTKNRDADVLQKILERNKAGLSPAKRLQLGRSSTQVEDSKFPWDDTNGAGWLPRSRAPRFNSGIEGSQTVSCTGGQWNTFEILGSEGPDLIVLTELYASLATTYAVCVTDWNVNTANLPSNPLTATTDWFSNVPGILYAAGMSGQRCGYWPGTEANGDSVTGVMKDEDTWTIIHDRGTPGADSGADDTSGNPSRLWISIYPTDTCTFHGRLHHGTG